MSKKTIVKAFALLALAALGNAQETVNGGIVVLGPLRSNGPQAAVDFTAAGSTSPVKSGPLASRPGTCMTSQMYFATDAPAGQSLAYCNASGTWSVVAGSAAGGVNVQSGTSYTPMPFGIRARFSQDSRFEDWQDLEVNGRVMLVHELPR